MKVYTIILFRVIDWLLRAVQSSADKDVYVKEDDEN